MGRSTGKERLTFAVLLAGCALVAGIWSASAAATTGTLYVTSDTTLSEAHIGSIVIATDNATLDCSGYQVSAPSPASDYGITVVSHTGVTIRNCLVSGFARSGFELNNVSESSFIGNVANENGLWGFAIHGASSFNTLTGNTANNNLTGFELWEGSAHNVLDGDVAVGNLTGFWVHDEGSDWNTFSADKANNNTYNGFAASSGDHNSWLNVVANNNTLLNGIALYDGSSYSTVTGCVARGNGQFDALETNPTSSANLWTSNHFGTTSPSGL